MDNFLLYLLKVSTGTFIFYLCYILFFSTDTFYRRNRIYLLMSLILPFIIPLTKIFNSSSGVPTIEPVKKMNEIIVSGAIAETTITEKITSANLSNLFTWFYFAIAGLLLLRVLISVTKAYSIIRKGTLSDSSFPKVILSELEYPPFSFFPFVVIPRSKFESVDFAEILKHENAHVKQGHTFDLIFSEILIAFLWFNPFMWLIKRSIVLNHEYLADNHALKNSGSIKEYQYRLLNITKGQTFVPLAHNYSSLIKNRILKINKKPTHNYAALKSIIIIPIVAILLVMGSLNNDELIPGYYSGTSGDEKFIPIGDYRNSDAPELDLSKRKDKDLIVNRLKWKGDTDMYVFRTIFKIDNMLEEHKDFAAGSIYDYDKASYKWENDSILKIVLINSLNKSTASYRINYDKNKNGTKIWTVGIHFQNPKDGFRDVNY
jgi:hypothetical protein